MVRGARVIETDDEWYYLKPDAPEVIGTRDELIRHSLGRGRKNPPILVRYQVEVRPDLGKYVARKEVPAS